MNTQNSPNPQDLIWQVQQKLRELRKIISQEKLTEMTIVSRPPMVIKVDEDEMGIPSYKTKSLFLSEPIFLPSLKNDWNELLLQHAIACEALLISNIQAIKGHP
jgi:hypothetical protein